MVTQQRARIFRGFFDTDFFISYITDCEMNQGTMIDSSQERIDISPILSYVLRVAEVTFLWRASDFVSKGI